MENKIFKRVSKGIASTIVAGFLLFSSTAVSEAAVVSKKVETNPQIKILNNNNSVSGVEPILIDGTTYVPVRSLSTVLNKVVQWDGPTKSIYITDTIDPNALKNEIYNLENFIKTKDARISELETSGKSKDAKIAELENAIKTKDARIAELEKQLKSNSSVSLKDLQKQLNKDYDYWKRMEFDITLKGNKNDIDVEIEIDLGDYEKTWYNLTSREIKTFINDIAEDIWYEYKNAEINGSVIDIDSDYELVEFYGEDGDLDIDIY